MITRNRAWISKRKILEIGSHCWVVWLASAARVATFAARGGEGVGGRAAFC